MGIKVTLRKKAISKGRSSLYLDFYPAVESPVTGELTRREFLGMYVFDKPKTPVDKQHNIDTTAIAESIRQKRENNYNKPEIYSDFEKERLRVKRLGDLDFIEYFKKLMNKRTGSAYAGWRSSLNYLDAFTGGSIKFSELTESKLYEFREYLLTTNSFRRRKNKLSQNSAASYFGKVKEAIKQAHKEGIIQTDLGGRVESIQEQETQPAFLDIEELNMLVRTECEIPVLKRAALFSCLTGLRFSDIEKMIWAELVHMKGQGHFISFRQEKSEAVEMMPISEQAYSFAGERGEPGDKVFQGLEYSADNNLILAEWLKAAGITKHVTFHGFRHTFATMQLFHGSDLYVVSKMLGHRSLKSTQRYTKVVDEQKRIASERIKLDL